MSNRWSSVESLPFRGGSALPSIAAPFLSVAAALLDAVAVVTANLLATAIFSFVSGRGSGDPDLVLAVGLLTAAVHAVAAHGSGLYRLVHLTHPAAYLRHAASLAAIVVLTITAVLFVLKIGQAVSRGALMLNVLLIPVLCGAARLLLAPLMVFLTRRNILRGRPVFLVGEAEEIAQLRREDLSSGFGFFEVGHVGLVEASDDESAVADAVARCRVAGGKSFVVVAGRADAKRLAKVEHGLRASPLPVQLLPGHDVRAIIGRRAGNGARSSLLIDLQRAPLGIVERATKRVLDVVLASLAALLLLPLLAAVTALLAVSGPGPVIFRQRRHGFDRREFVIYKFRTMHVTEDGPVIEQAHRGDARITRLGRILRATSIDELPQLLNVLRGEMSLVGPRPHALAHDTAYERSVARYGRRHHVKPGITGWAQVNGCRGETARTDAMVRRVDLDLWYIDNWSLLLDLQILARTVVNVLAFDAV